MGCHSFRRFWFGLAILVAIFCNPCTAFCNESSGVTDLSGHRVNPFEMARGKAVVLIFVRTDCPVANRYAPEIQRLSATFAASSKFFLVYVDPKESAETIRKHDREFGYSLIALRDSQHVLVKQSLAQITPEVAVFDSRRQLLYHGRIDNLYEDFGHARKVATRHELAEALRAVAAGQSPASPSAPAVGCYIADVQ